MTGRRIEIEATVQKTTARAAPTLAYLALVYAGLQIYLWWVVPLGKPAATAAGALLVLALLIADPWLRHETPRSIGLDFSAFPGAIRALLPGAAALAVAIVALGFLSHGGGHGRRYLMRVLGILPWALLQQSMLQCVFNRRLTAALGPGWAAPVITAACFGLMHLPGLLLTAATAAAGLWWSRLYQRRPNIWALVLCHALLSALAQSWLPGAWTHGFRVGPGWFRWHP